jgi:hypothetical protein
MKSLAAEAPYILTILRLYAAIALASPPPSRKPA